MIDTREYGEQEQQQRDEYRNKNGDDGLESSHAPFLQSANDGIEQVGDDSRHDDRNEYRLQIAEDLPHEPNQPDEQQAKNENGNARGSIPESADLKGGGMISHVRKRK